MTLPHLIRTFAVAAIAAAVLVLAGRAQAEERVAPALFLTAGEPSAHIAPVSRPGGRSEFARGGKSGLHGNTVPDNVRRG